MKDSIAKMLKNATILVMMYLASYFITCKLSDTPINYVIPAIFVITILVVQLIVIFIVSQVKK